MKIQKLNSQSEPTLICFLFGTNKIPLNSNNVVTKPEKAEKVGYASLVLDVKKKQLAVVEFGEEIKHQLDLASKYTAIKKATFLFDSLDGKLRMSIISKSFVPDHSLSGLLASGDELNKKLYKKYTSNKNYVFLRRI